MFLVKSQLLHQLVSPCCALPYSIPAFACSLPGRREGLKFVNWRTWPNTLLCSRLIHLAGQRGGWQLQHRAKGIIFRMVAHLTNATTNSSLPLKLLRFTVSLGLAEVQSLVHHRKKRARARSPVRTLMVAGQPRVARFCGGRVDGGARWQRTARASYQRAARGARSTRMAST